MRSPLPLLCLLAWLPPVAWAADPAAPSSEGTYAPAGDYAPVRKAFQDAWAHAAVPNPAADDAALKAYPLYPYLQAERIRQALRAMPAAPATPAAPAGGAAAADQAAAAFIAGHAGTSVAVLLRRSWLDSLAQRQDWTAFLAAYRDGEATEAQRCLSLQARIALGPTADLAADIARQWLTPRAPLECDAPFAWLVAHALAPPDVIERRIRMALDGGNTPLARPLIALLPSERQAPWLQWAGLLDNPKAGIDALIAAPGQAVTVDALLAGWTQLARTDAAAAAERFPNFARARGLSPQAASRYALAVALGLAWNRDRSALEYFDQVAASDLDDAALEWHARAALWSKDWPQAARAIAALSPTLRQSTRWRYWSARVADQLAGPEAARPLYESALADDNYYSALAAAHLHRRVLPHPQELPEDGAVLQGVAHLGAFVRARELFLCDLRAEAAAEWQYGYDALPAAQRAQAARLAARWGWYDQAVLVASSLKLFNDYGLLYPRPFEPEVDAAAQRAQLPRDLVYGVLRQESLFRPDAVSSAGALGLMQLKLPTARLTARALKRPAPTAEQLLEPATNTTLGAAQLRLLLDQFGGQLPAALAGYNAGPNAVQRWLPPQPVDADIWVENIPYNETRAYVQRILWHTLVYAWLRTDQGQATAAWLAPIRPVHVESAQARR